MIDLLAPALVALQGAYESRRLYTPGSPVAASRLANAVETLSRLALAHPGATIMLLADRVVAGDELVPQGDCLMQGGLGRLATRGVAGLRIDGPPTSAQLVELLAAMERPDQSLPAGGPLRLLHAGQEPHPPGRTPQGRPAIPASIITRLQGVLDPLSTHAQLETQHLASLTGELATLAITSGNSLIPLSDLRTHDEYTYVHTINVALLSSALAQAIGLAPDRVHDITCAAMLHDVGKVRTPREVLNKQGGFTPDELAIMRRHPEEGARVLVAAGVRLDAAIAVAYEHHMHRSGGGYPKMPPRWRMHLASQIVQVADVYDALRTNRPYRAAMTIEQARNAMEQDTGKVFDPQLLTAFFDRVAMRASHAA